MVKMCVRLAALLCFLASASAAFAEGFGLYEYSARGIALGGAMMARKPDPSAVAYNPALLTRLPGKRAAAGVTFIKPVGKMEWGRNLGYEDTELRDSLWAVPHAYYTHQINDDWFFGIGEFSRFGLGFEYPHSWPGRFNIYEVALKSGSLNPVLAWKATDKLSLAAGVEIVYVTLDIKTRSKPPIPKVPGTFMEVDSSITDAEDWGVGGNFAAHYQFSDQWAIGLQYRSQVRVHAYGDVEYTYLGLDGPFAGAPGVSAGAKAGYDKNFNDGTAHSTVILPDSIAAGIAWTPIPELSMEVGAIWTRWSTFDSLDINLPDPIGEKKSKKDWRNTWRFNAGVEWEPLDWLSLRLGYVYDQSPMTNQYADYLVPTASRHIYSGGVGFAWDAWTLDLAYAYIDPMQRRYSPTDDMGVLRSKTKNSNTQMLSVTLGYEF